jgi:hypothetical protein
MEADRRTDGVQPDPERDAELASLHGVLDEVGTTYPLLAYIADSEQADDEETPLDPLIFEGLIRP